MVSHKVTCGTCGLHASHFYGNSKHGYVGPELQSTCCADTEFDMPASWSNRTVMAPEPLRWCALWRPVDEGEVQPCTRS